MGILLLYNQTVSYSFQDIAERTGLGPEVLIGQLNLLVKFKVLNIKSGKLGDQSSICELNTEFKRYLQFHQYQ